MRCKQVKEELVFLFADNEMGQEMVVAYKRHVSICPHCAREADFARLLLKAVRRAALSRRPPQGLRTRILASLPHRRRPV